jgi:hypothetical protein
VSNLYSLGRAPISALNTPRYSDVNVEDNTPPRLIVLFHNQPISIGSEVPNFEYPVFRKHGKMPNCTIQGQLIVGQFVKKLSAFVKTK